MASPVADSPKKLPLFPLTIAGVFVLLALAAWLYVRRPAAPANTADRASSEATAYLPHLQLSDVSVKASENFMQQQVVEVQGKIANNGPRPLDTVAVYCLFYDANGRELHRERLPILHSKVTPLHPGETRSFRLPFDALPDGWNQAMPKLVVAEITFADR